MKPKMEALGLDPTQQKWFLFWDTYALEPDASIFRRAMAEFRSLMISFVPTCHVLGPTFVAVAAGLRRKVLTTSRIVASVSGSG